MILEVQVSGPLSVRCGFFRQIATASPRSTRLRRPPAWTGQEAQALPGASCRLDWVIIDRLLEIAGGNVELAQQDFQRLLNSANEEGDQAAAVFWQCHLAAFRSELEQLPC